MIYLASFKGTKTGWQGLIERLTRWVTKSDYAHSEICIGNPFESAVLCASSVGTDGGVRAKTMQLLPNDWEILPMPWVTEQSINDFLNDHSHDGYDVIGTIRTVLPFVSCEHPAKWFCSEVVATIAGFIDPWRYAPANLHVSVKSINELKD